MVLAALVGIPLGALGGIAVSARAAGAATCVGQCHASLAIPPCTHKHTSPPPLATQAGSFLFAGKFPARDYRPQLDQSADALDEVLMPEHEGEPVTGAKKALLRDLPPWLVNPSYQRVRNRGGWAGLGGAVGSQWGGCVGRRCWTTGVGERA